MKRMIKGILIFLLPGILASCNPSDSSETNQVSCNSEIVGNWNGTTINDKTIIRSDETYSYVGSDGCTGQGSISCPGDVTMGTLVVTIESASAGNCLAAGLYRCAFALPNNNTLIYNCGAGDYYYSRE